MSNPVATIGDYIPHPGDPQVVRRTFTRIVFEQQAFFYYGEGEYDPTYSTFDPSDKGERFYMWIPMEYALGGTVGSPATKPDFVSSEAWADLRWAPSGFVQGAINSVLPKIVVPSELLVDNGVWDINQFRAYSYDTAYRDLFNWEMIEFNGSSIISDYYRYGSTGGMPGAQYATFRPKEDDRYSNEMEIWLRACVSPPLGSDHDWLLADSSNLVIGGAFCIMLNVVPERPGAADPFEVSENPWQIQFLFGDVEMILSAGGEMRARISGTAATSDWVTVNMAEGKAKGGPPQQQHIDDKSPYIIMVYPVWNGLIISSGVQEARTNSKLTTPTLAASAYVPKLKEASIWIDPWSDGFDPTNPDEVEVGVGSGATDVTVDFGDQMTVISKNCRFEIAYLPCWFSKELWFDEWFVTSDNIDGSINFDYEVYPIWTANGGASELDPAPEVTESSTVGPVEDTHYSYVKWRLSQDHFDRIPGQIFGSILEVEETREFAVRNANGNFSLTWVGGTPGDPSPGSWEDYIQGISVSIGLDGSSGSATVDKYGIAGQEAVVVQNIGAFTVDMNGGFGTRSGNIFKGLAMGVSDARSSGGGTWTIPLVGLEKKMDDIALINVPFMDGYTLSEALRFLTKYAGLISDLSYADPFVHLSVSEDINVARFDWKSGTNVRTAIEDVMNDTNHTYVVQDGKIEFYELDDYGLPTSYMGTNWEPDYPDTKVVTTDQTPDFEDLRNEIVVLGLEAIFEGQNTDLSDVPTVPRFEKRSSTTTPSVPWARSAVLPTSGFLTLAEIEDYADKEAARARHYLTIGRTSIPGNADIRLYDRWGNAWIHSITHNVDLQAKTWTTDLEFTAR